MVPLANDAYRPSGAELRQLGLELGQIFGLTRYDLIDVGDAVIVASSRAGLARNQACDGVIGSRRRLPGRGRRPRPGSGRSARRTGPGGDRVDHVAQRQHRISERNVGARQGDDPDADADDIAARSAMMATAPAPGPARGQRVRRIQAQGSSGVMRPSAGAGRACSGVLDDDGEEWEGVNGRVPLEVSVMIYLRESAARGATATLSRYSTGRDMIATALVSDLRGVDESVEGGTTSGLALTSNSSCLGASTMIVGAEVEVACGREAGPRDRDAVEHGRDRRRAHALIARDEGLVATSAPLTRKNIVRAMMMLVSTRRGPPRARLARPTGSGRAGRRVVAGQRGTPRA